MSYVARKPKTTQTIRRYVGRIILEENIRCPPVPVEQVAYTMGAEIRYSPYEGELAGMLVRRGNQVIIGVNSSHHINRQRFTIAHELGHLALHKPDFHLDRSFSVKRRDIKSSLAVDPDEIEANRFAAELLMPYEMISEDLIDLSIDFEDETEVRRLASRYRVSVQAMTHRIANVIGF